MRVLIVGCGYVGVPLGAALAGQGHMVYGLRRTAFEEQELRVAGIQPLSADITRPESLAVLPSHYDWVVHCVSATGGGVEEYRRVYLDGTRNLLTWLAAAPPQKLIYTSSTSVYGQTDGSLVTESSATEPLGQTGRILLQTEELVCEAGRSSGFASVILRVAGIYGPGRGYWLKQYLKGEAQLEGGGERILNMIHRDDVAGSASAALASGKPSEIYNAVDDEPVRQVELFKWLARKLGRELPPIAAEPEDPPGKRGLTNKCVVNRKLKEELGYRFKYPTFREGMASELKFEHRTLNFEP